MDPGGAQVGEPIGPYPDRGRAIDAAVLEWPDLPVRFVNGGEG